MLRYNKKIKKSALSNNQTSKYFKYAIGEIILVVIGILIALQINNWNEDKTTRKIEVSILNELLSDSKTNIESLREDIYLNRRTIQSNLLIKDALINGAPYHDSLNIHFGNIQYNTQLTVNTGGFENLKSRGFEYLSNDVLRKSIINLYDQWYDFIEDVGEKNNKISIEQFDPEYKQFFTDYKRDFSSYYVSFKPSEYNTLVGNQDFLRLIADQKYNNDYTIQVLEKAILEINDLINQLETELKTR